MSSPVAVVSPDSASARTAVPGGRSDGWWSFFRYHGVWSPGVRLFRAIGFFSKAGVIALIFMLPIAVLAQRYFSNQAAQIDFSAKERLGITYQRELLPLLSLLQRQRLLSLQATIAADASQAQGELSTLKAPLEAQRARLAAVQKDLGSVLGTLTAYADFEKTGKALSSGATSADAVFVAHTAHVQALLDLLSAATDGSNLTLDPDIDTYYLMDAAMFRLPVMLEAVAQLRGLGATMLKSASGTPAQLRTVIEQATLAKSNHDALVQGVNKASAYNADVKASVSLTAQQAAFAAVLQRVDGTLLRAEGVQGDAPAHVAIANKALDAMMQLDKQATDKLDELIATRVAGLEAARNWAAVVVMISLAAAVYVFICFGKVLEGGLREVAFHINAMRDGDLTTRPRAWGRDEAARLMETLSQMQESLRRIVWQVRTVSDCMVSASAEISTGASELRSRTEQAAANLEETATAMEQIAATVKRNEDIMDQASVLGSDNSSAAKQGGNIMDQLVRTMRAIDSTSGRIGDIIGTIEGIAFQTNILALNAAVEAARAGEQGRGFAVVASEVRALAHRSSVASKEIKTLISGSLEQAQTGVRVVQQAGDSIQQILGTAERVRALLAEVSVGAREQSAGVSQTASAVQQLDSATQQNASLVEQTANSAGLLREQALVLAQEVSRFKLPAA